MLRVPDRILGGQGHLWCHGWLCFAQRKIPWKFRVDIFIRSVSRMGGLPGETWRTGSLSLDCVKISLSWLNYKYHFWSSKDNCSICRCHFSRDRFNTFPVEICGGQGNPWCHGWPCLTQRRIPWKFRFNIFIRSVSRRGIPLWWYLEDIEGSWQDTW